MGSFSKWKNLLISLPIFLLAVGPAYSEELDEPSDHEESDHLYETGLPFPLPPSRRLFYPYYVSTSVRELHNNLYRRVFDAILANATFFNEPTTKIKSPFNFKTPEELKSIINLTLPEHRVSESELMDLIHKVIEYSPKATHPYKVDKHASGLDPYGLIGDWLTTIMSSISLVYHTAPVYMLMEHELKTKVHKLARYPGSKGEGVIAPGSAAGNGYAIQLALQKKFPLYKTKGIAGCGHPIPVLFVSEHGSFSHDKYCIWEGIGINGCYRVETDAKGQMSVEDLEKKIKLALSSGQTPFMIIATAGTSILGAIDPIRSLAIVAKKYKLWLHIDCHLASGAALSKIHRYRLDGSKHSDSFLWSPDKGLSSPSGGAVLVAKNPTAVSSAFRHDVQFLFAASQTYNNTGWETGDFTLQCSRRPEVLKMWFMLKTKGHNALAQHVDYTFKMVTQAVEELKARESSFKLILNQFESAQIAFYYVPKCLRGFSIAVAQKAIHATRYTQQLKAQLLRKGIMTISVNILKSSAFPLVPFFVMSLRNSALRINDLRYLLDQIENEGENRDALNDLEEYLLEEKLISAPKDLMVGTQKTVLPPIDTIPYPYFVSAPIKPLHHRTMLLFSEFLLNDATYFEERRGSLRQPPWLFRTPKELWAEFGFSLSDRNGTTIEGAMKVADKVVRYTTHLSHPYYNYHLFQGLNPYTVIAEYVSSALNSQMVTYEDNPLFTLMEQELGKAMRKVVGYPEDGDVMILPGGSASIQTAFELAYIKKFPEAKWGGIAATKKTPVAFVSDGAHYAGTKGAFFMGLGKDNCINVPVDAEGRMTGANFRKAVEQSIKDGGTPFYVTVTGGTTVIGAFDKLDEIADVCKEFGIHLHVDASYGGGTLFSNYPQTIIDRFPGVERSDSINTNPHKVFGAAKVVSILVTRQSKAFSLLAPKPSDEEFNNKELYDGKKLDSGINHLFPDHRADVFKAWLLWKAIGRHGMGEHVDYGYNLTKHVMQEVLRRNESFDLTNPPNAPTSAHVNLHYIPKSLRNVDRNSKEFLDKIHQFTYILHRRIMRSKKITIANKSVGDRPTDLILSLYQSTLTLEDCKYFLDIIEYYGQDL